MGPGLAGGMTDDNEEASYRRESRRDTQRKRPPPARGPLFLVLTDQPERPSPKTI